MATLKPVVQFCMVDDQGNVTDTYLYTQDLPVFDFVGPEGTRLVWIRLRDLLDVDLNAFPDYNRQVLAALKK